MTIKLMSGSRVVKLSEYFFGVRFIGKGHRNNLTNVAFPKTITRQKFQYENVLFLLNVQYAFNRGRDTCFEQDNISVG